MSFINSSQIRIFPKDRPLYKFLKKEHLDCFFKKGVIRVGTLFNFRNEELYGAERGDSGEGKKEIFEIVNETIANPLNNTLSPFAQQRIKIEETALNCKIINSKISELHNSPNYFIYCFSKDFDKTLYEKLEADVCIKIRSPYKFVSYISKSLKKQGNLLWLTQVVYGERIQSYGEHDLNHPAIIKEARYKYQKEVRALWEPKEKLIHNPFLDVVIPVKCIKRHCEIFDEL